MCSVTGMAMFLAAVVSGCGATSRQTPDQVLEERPFELRISWDRYQAELRDQEDREDQDDREVQEARSMSGAGHGNLLAIPMKGRRRSAPRVVDLTNKRPLIGYVYWIEGYLNGQRVIYVGSAASIKQRLVRYGSQHRWTKLLRQKSTIVHVKKVYGNLDIKASNAGTLLSAQIEALTSMEEPELKREEKKAARENRERAPGQKRTRIGNARRAASEPELWQKRHNTIRDSKWIQIKHRGKGIKLPTAIGAALLIAEAYTMYLEEKKPRYVMAPYVLEDDHGAFTMFERGGVFSSTYYKRYIAGPYQGKKVKVNLSQWMALAHEAVAVWGMLDDSGDFVPGLLQPTLPVFDPYIARVARSVARATVDPTR